MGAWGNGVFENDAAWSGIRRALSEKKGIQAIRCSLESFLQQSEAEGYDRTQVGENPGNCVFALAELVAAAAGLPSRELEQEDELVQWAAEHSQYLDDTILELAYRSVVILSGSEKIRELSDGERDPPLRDLTARLSVVLHLTPRGS